MSDWIAADLAKSGLSMDDAKAAGIKISQSNSKASLDMRA